MSNKTGFPSDNVPPWKPTLGIYRPQGGTSWVGLLNPPALFALADFTVFSVIYFERKELYFSTPCPKSRGASVLRSVQESNVFMASGLRLSEKQIPRIVENIGNQERGRSY
jgi:hypothetical protein